MSRENRRRAAARPRAAVPAAPRPQPSTRAVAPAPPRAPAEGERVVSWRHCLVGIVAGEALLLLITNGGLDLANYAFGAGGRIDGGITGMGSFLAVIVGGYIAARLAGRWGVYQGIVVAIGFIFIGAAYQFGVEASIVHSSLVSQPATGAKHLVDLGPMNLGGVFSGDLLALFGGSFGGWLARR